MILNNKYHLTQYKKNSMKKQFHNYTINEDINFYICSQWRKNVVFKAMISDLIFHRTYLHAWIIKDENDLKNTTINPFQQHFLGLYVQFSAPIYSLSFYLYLWNVHKKMTNWWHLQCKKEHIKALHFTHCL